MLSTLETDFCFLGAEVSIILPKHIGIITSKHRHTLEIHRASKLNSYCTFTNRSFQKKIHPTQSCINNNGLHNSSTIGFI